jgi:serine/threonine protein kinase
MKFPAPFSQDFDLIFFLMQCFKSDFEQRPTIEELFNHDWITQDLSIFDESEELPESNRNSHGFNGDLQIKSTPSPIGAVGNRN